MRRLSGVSSVFASAFTCSLVTARISAAIAEIFDLRPRAIIDALDLKRPIYAKTAAHGHFGRDEPDFTWENVRQAVSKLEVAGAASTGR